MDIIQPKIISLPKFYDERGNLTFIERADELCPFTPKRVFWTFNVPSGSSRGGHAYRSQTEFIVAINGAFVVHVRNQNNDEFRFRLDRADMGLLLPPMLWRSLENFSNNAMSLHLSDTEFTDEDYIYDYNYYRTK